jgi:hypothetical protein
MNKVYKTLLFLFTIILLKFHTTDAMVPCRLDIQCEVYCQMQFNIGIRPIGIRPIHSNVRGKCVNNFCSCYCPA